MLKVLLFQDGEASPASRLALLGEVDLFWMWFNYGELDKTSGILLKAKADVPRLAQRMSLNLLTIKFVMSKEMRSWLLKNSNQAA